MSLSPETGRATIGPIYPSTQEISDDGATYEDALGPYDSAYDFLFDGIKRQSERADSHLTQLTFLRVFAPTLLDDSYTSPPFVLAFPDYNYDNTLVDDEGYVTGLLDWDSTFVVPRQEGFARYPSWITRDWDPTAYAWPPRDVESAGIGSLYEENSPQTLQRYRDEYLEVCTQVDPADAIFTKNSHIFEAIQIGIFRG